MNISYIWVREINAKLIVALLACLLILIPTASAGNVTIDSSDSIQDTVDAAADDDVISLDAGTYRESGIEIDKDISVQGKGSPEKVIVDGGYEDTIVSVSSPCKVSFKNLTFTKGFSKTSAGAIKSHPGSEITIENCIFKNNLGANGGAINIEGASDSTWGKLTIRNCRFVSNAATGDGGAISTDLTRTTIYDSVFTDNSGQNGGAIRNNAYLVLADCEMKDNTASNGGAVFNSLGEIFAFECNIVSNRARQKGGAFYSTGTLTVYNSMIIDNRAKTAGIIYVGKDGEMKPITDFKQNRIIGNTASDKTLVYFEAMAPHGSDFNDNYWGGVNPGSSIWNRVFITNGAVENPERWEGYEVKTIPHYYTYPGEYGTKLNIYGRFLKNTGEPLSNAMVIFKINSKEYKVKTNSDGVGLLNVKLDPGNYTITLINPETGESVSFNTEIPEPTYAHFTNNTVIMKDGKAVGAVSYTINLHGVKTTTRTEKGIISKAITIGREGITFSTKSNNTVIKDRITPRQIAHYGIIAILLAITAYGCYRYKKKTP